MYYKGSEYQMNLILRDIYYNFLCNSILLHNKIRYILYKCGGVKLGKKTTICPNCFVGNNNLSIGDNCFINYDVWFNTAGGIFIGNNCNIAFGVRFITSSHHIGKQNRRAGHNVEKSIKVGNGTWIGANTTILPGIKIGDGCIIGARSVVTKDCKDNCIYGGNPAKLIRQLSRCVKSTT